MNPMTLTLHRLIHTAHGIIGRMGEFYTLENRWRDNAVNISSEMGIRTMRPK